MAINSPGELFAQPRLVNLKSGQPQAVQTAPWITADCRQQDTDVVHPHGQISSGGFGIASCDGRHRKRPQGGTEDLGPTRYSVSMRFTLSACAS